MKKRLISMALVLVMVLSLLPASVLAVNAEDFTDLKADAWYYEGIEFVVDKGYFNGMSDTEFQPKTEMTRAMFVTVIARVEGAEIDNSVESSFPDCKSNVWYTGSVEWAAENGIVTGYEDGNFRPNGNVTRQEMCTIMDRYIEWRCEQTGEEHVTDGEDIVFTDEADIAGYAKEYVQNCVAYGLVEGYPDGSFLPRNNSTRAEVATVICRLDWIVNETPDNPSNPSNPSGPSNPDDPTYTDYIYTGVSGVAADLADLAESYVVKANKLSNEYKAYITALNENVSDIDFGKYVAADYEIGDIDGAKRPVTIEAGIELNQETANNLVKVAAGSAVAIFGDAKATWAEIKTVVDAVKEDLAIFGLSPISDVDAAQITELIYNYIKSKGNIWTDNFKGTEGYYTGDIKVACGSYNGSISVSDKGVSVDNWKKQGVDFAIALAKEIYSDVASKASNWVHEISDIEALVDITFSAGAYAEDTDNFPYNYPVTLNLDVINDVEALQYKFDGYSHLKLYVSDKVQAEIKEKANAAADKIMASETVKAEISEAIDSAMTTDQFQQLINVLVKTKMTEAQANKLVEDYLDKWISANVSNVMAGEEWANDYIYALTGVVAAQVSTYLEKAFDSAVFYEMVKESDVTPAGIDSTFSKLNSYGVVDFNLDGINADLKNYVFAVICDDVIEAQGWTVKNYEAAYETAMKAYIDTIVEDAIAGEPKFEKAMEYAEKLRGILADMSKLEDVKLGNLATALRIDYMQDYVASKGDESYIAKVCAYLDKLPAGASVTIAGVKIDKALLEDLRDAKTVAEVCEALAAIIEIPGLANLTIGDFAPQAGQDVTVAYNSRSFKANLVIEIQ